MNFQHNGLEIAIIGMAGRFPGCNNIDEFWENLKAGVELISVFPNIKPAKIETEHKIKAGGVLSNVELFDASFFGFNPREAEAIDPQHRLFLECAWEGLENAGYNSETETRPIGVYAGVGMGTYLLYNLSPNQGWIESKGFLQTLVGVDKDYLASRVSYKLNLTGPSVSIGTACSSSLVAVHLACQSLLSGECDMAIGAGVAVKVPQNELTLSPEEIVAADGHCKAFDAKANGTVGGNGIGVVVLKRLEDAIADRDKIYAVIKGSAINNDGACKVGYTAPSQEGQAKAIRTAQIMAEVEPESITYIETHGTGTVLGDPIEIAAMTQAFRATTDKKNYCAIGSVKTNVGHLDAAAGIVGLIKTVLALNHKLIPPSINFETPNPQIDFANSPFYVNTKLAQWKTNESPRRAGVSSFGFGGTNAHVILEEAPPLTASSPSPSPRLLVLSAKTSSALETATKNLATYLKQHPDLDLADVAYTLQVGRQAFNHRRMVVGENLADVVKSLESVDTQFLASSEPHIVFMFTGQGSQYVNMGKELYEHEITFREECDRCFDFLQQHLDIDLSYYLYPTEIETPTATQKLQQTAITQPALFVIEYALAKLWMSWEISPVAMIGHSIGEYVAATIAGVFSLEDALSLVVTRGRMMQQLPQGAMLSVSLSAQKVQSFLNDNLSLAASNGTSLSVVSGTIEAVAKLEQQLTAKGIEYRRLHTSHAFHSPMMEAVVEPFTSAVEKIQLNSPQIPFISNLTGNWITPELATDPKYWAQHLRQPVRFAEGIAKLLQDAESIFLEIGPGRTLSTLTKQQASERVILSSLRHPQEKHSDVGFLLNTLGRLWLTGVQVNWSNFYQHQKRNRLPLPTYPFERQRYWIDPPEHSFSNGQITSNKKADIADWFYIPSWKRSVVSIAEVADEPRYWLVFLDECGFGSEMLQLLEQQGHHVIQVKIGEKFSQESDRLYTINPGIPEHYETLVKAVINKNPLIAHLWSLNPYQYLAKTQEICFYSLIYLAQAIARQNSTRSLQIGVVSDNIQEVIGGEIICAEKAILLGASKVINQEYPNILCRSIDIILPESVISPSHNFIQQIITELTIKSSDLVVAYRGNYRWIETFEPIHLEKSSVSKTRFRQEGVYLITGGFGGIGLSIAEYLATTVKAKLALLGRSTIPAKADWEQWLTNHDEQNADVIKIRQVQQLEKLGAEVLILSADVANQEQMQTAVTQIYQRFGNIHGVIHAAGILGKGEIQLKTPAMSTPIFAAKLQGTLVLDNIFKDTQLDFFILWSSISSIVGGFGQVDYAAANAFLDRFARQKSNSSVISINWDMWQEVGMAVSNSLPNELKKRYAESLKQGITVKEGIEAWTRILQTKLPQVVVTKQDLQVMIEQSITLKSQFSQPKVRDIVTQSFYPRPDLPNTYEAAHSEVERIIADIWQELLGVEKVGIYDNFFDLGGHSLLATQVISRLRQTLQINLPVNSLYEAPTVADISIYIENHRFLSQTLQPIANAGVGDREEGVL